MSPARRSCVLGGLVCASVVVRAAAAAHATEIEHKAVGCVAAEQFPRMEARLTPADSVGRARVFFRTEGGPSWYAVAMKRDGEVFTAALPKPRKSLKQFRYYVEVSDKAAATSRTEEYTTDVVTGAGGCSKGMMAGVMSVASILLEAPAGAAAIPVGFSSAGVVAAAGSTATAAAGGAAASSGGGGLGTGAIVGGLGAVAAAGAVVAVKAAGSDDHSVAVTISGQVFAHFGPNPATNGLGPGLYSNPVAGALVSTSLDSTTATTDGEGRFRLSTRAERSDLCITLTITASGLPTYSLPSRWGTGTDRTISLSPPVPSNSDCTP